MTLLERFVGKTILKPLHPALYGAFILLSLAGGCRNKENQDHPHFLDHDIRRALELNDSAGPEKSLLYIDSAYQKIKNPGIGDKVARYEHIRHCRSQLEKRYDTNMVYIDSILYTLQGYEKREKYQLPLMKALLSKGDALFAMNKYDEAYQYYFKANLMAEKLDSHSYSYLYTSRLANAYFHQARYASAMIYYKKALEQVRAMTPQEIADKQYHFALEQKYINNIGLCYERGEKPDSAIVYYNQVMDLINKYEKVHAENWRLTKIWRGVVMGNLGSCYHALGESQKAEEYLLASIKINDQRGFDQKDAQTARLKLADLYLSAGRNREAKAELETLKLSLDSLPHQERYTRWLELQWKYYKNTGDKTQAARYLEEFAMHLKQEEKLQREEFGTDVNRQFENIERQHEVDLLINKNQLQRTYLVSAIFISLGGLFITFLLWFNWRQSRRNIAKLTLLNEQINVQNRALNETNKEKDRIMKALAHDLRNPMSGIHSIASIMLDDPTLSDENREMLQMIHSSSLYSTEMTRDLADATLNDPKESLVKTETDLFALLKQCVNILQFKAGEKNQRIELKPAKPLTLTIDPEKINRVINNIITNAIKFSDPGSQIFISLDQKSNTAVIKVKDSGIGIPENLKDRVYDMFTIAKRYGTGKEKPFGLGLSISRQIVEAHDGRIWFESKENEGTTFFVELPLSH